MTAETLALIVALIGVPLAAITALAFWLDARMTPTRTRRDI